VYQEKGNFVDYCHKIRELCRNELDSREFSKKLIEVLKNLNQIKQKAKLKLSIYIIEKTDEK
jgi:5-carboxymethyl-2-hydroxymuconate isomerase